MKKVLSSILVLVIFSFFPQLSYAEKFRLKVGYLAVAGQLPLVVSNERDNSSFQKVNVVLKKYKSWTSLEAALTVGAVDAGVMTAPIVFSMAEKGVPVKVIGMTHRGGSTFVIRGVDSIADLRNRLIGVLDPDNTENLVLHEFFKKYNLRLGMDVRTIGITFGLALYDIEHEKVDGLFLPEPVGQMILDKKVGNVLDEAKDLMKNRVSSLLLVRESVLNSSSAAVQEWVDSVEESCAFIEKDIKDTGGKQCSIIQEKYFGYDRDLFEHVLMNHQGSLSFDNLRPSYQELKVLLNTAEEIQLITSSVDLKSLVDLRFKK